MKIRYILIFAGVILFNLPVIGDEGMWLPSFLSKLNIEQMQQLGSDLTADDIYNINNSSIKDAVIEIDHGSCTGEIVSPDGLFLTNHHCGYSDIQKHSTEENNILRDGYWAKNREDELPNPGKTVSFLIRVEDVTDSINSSLKEGMSEKEREDTIISVSVRLEEKATFGTHYEATVESFFAGNKYYLFVLETFNDIRLVGTPPHFIGKFGSDTDNWMWPRHTGDFSIYRIYTGKDGKPAEYSKDNIPLKSRHFLPISLKGYEKDDFTLVMGYPGTTKRYLTSEGVKFTMETLNEARIRVREEKLDIINDYMSTGDLPTIQYASKYAKSSNYYKYSIGQNRGLERLKVIEKKKQAEGNFLKWLNENEERNKKYGEALPLISEAYSKREDDKVLQFIIESFFLGPEIFNFAQRFKELRGSLKIGNDKDMTDLYIERLTNISKDFYEDYDAATDEKIVASLAKVYSKNVGNKYKPDFFKTIEIKYKGDYQKWAEAIFKKSMFDNREKVEGFLKNPKFIVLESDPVYIISQELGRELRKIRKENEPEEEKIDKGYRLYLSGLLEMNPGKLLYPDANSTLRLTYGKIEDYYPADAVHYDYFTTLKGYIEKEKPGDREFDVWPQFKEMYFSSDFGDYADKDGTLHTCFISNNDITGGNSGSPVLNKKGELIGIAFDGNWEAMSGDIAFEADYQRCINVDIRFVLWIIDKFSGASYLLDEMTIIK